VVRFQMCPSLSFIIRFSFGGLAVLSSEYMMWSGTTGCLRLFVRYGKKLKHQKCMHSVKNGRTASFNRRWQGWGMTGRIRSSSSYMPWMVSLRGCLLWVRDERWCALMVEPFPSLAIVDMRK
jgi:hypothetical protein